MRTYLFNLIFSVSVISFPFVSFSAADNFDGKWKIALECSQTQEKTKAGARVDGFIEKYEWDIKNSGGLYNDKRGAMETEWKLQIKDKIIFVESVSSSDIKSQRRISLKGEMKTESIFEATGGLFNNKGNKVRDCKMKGERIS